MKKQNKTPEKNTGTVIGVGIVIEDALLKGTGIIRIDGNFQGTINLNGHVILGETGMLGGDVHAESALFAGKYEGNLHIKDTLHITSTAVLNGRVETGKIIIDEGGVFNGICNVAKANGQKAQPAAPPVAVRETPGYKPTGT